MMAICLSPCPLGLHSELVPLDLQFATNIPTKEACVWCRGEGIDGRGVEKTSLLLKLAWPHENSLNYCHCFCICLKICLVKREKTSPF